MSSRAWDGHAELREALQGLACAKGTSATRVKAVANAAFKYVKDYKRVVHDVEMFLWKADVEHRLAGLYAVDAIIRQSQLKFGAKDQFTKRFALHLTNTITAVKSIPADSQQHVRHVVQEWQTRGFYSATQIEDAGGQRYSISNSSKQPPHSAPQREETTPKASTGKLASLLSIIKKQKERNDQQLDVTVPSVVSDAQQQQHNAPSLLGSPPRSARIAPQSSSSSSSSSSSQHPRPGSPPRPGGILSTPLPHQQRPPSTIDADFQRHRPYEHDERKRGVSDALLQEPPASTAIGGRVPREQDDEWYDTRNSKKQRGSRWGPPKPAPGGSDDLRPPPIATMNVMPARHDERGPPPLYPGGSGGAPMAHSPTRRPDGHFGVPAGGGAPMQSPGQYPPSIRANGWQEQGGAMAPHDAIRQPPPGVRGGFGTGERDTFQDAKRFAQGPPNAFGPPGGGRLDDNRAMVSPRHHGGGPGDRIPGSSGELCRKFVFGRCTYGDQCWHRHDEQEATHMRQHPELFDRRKSVLCTNFPRGACRFGDRCSYAHGEQELERPAPQARGDDVSMGDAHAYDHRASAPPLAAAAAKTTTVTAPAPLNRPNGTGPPLLHHAVYNEVQGDRGKSGASSISPHATPGPGPGPGPAAGGSPFQPPFQHPPSASANTNSHQDRAAGAPSLQVGAVAGVPGAPAKDTFASRAGPSGPPGLPPPRPSGGFPPRGFASMPPRPPPPGMMGPPPPRPLPPGMMGPPPPRTALSYPPASVPSLQPPVPRHLVSTTTTTTTTPAAETRPGTSSVDPVDEDDDGESAAPEFTLQYDDDD